MSESEHENETPPWVPTATRVVASVCYCGACSMPLEYCEFSGSSAKCRQWAQAHAPPAEFQKVYGSAQDASGDAMADLAAGTAALDLEDAPAGGDAAKAADPKKAAARQKKEERKRLAQMIVLRLDRRKGKKVVTLVSGLDNYGIELKKAAKLFANKFACGATVSKNAEGREEVTVQGEFIHDLQELIAKEYSQIPSEAITVVEK